MIKPLLTIITITYNRVSTLPKLYKSLQVQNNKNFKWLIVDDGSSDGTEEYIRYLKSLKNEFCIQYIKRPNIGKYKEMNFILPKIDTKLLFFLDSDDCMVKNGVEKIEDTYYKCYGNVEIGSFIFERAESDGITPMNRIYNEFIDRRYYYMVRNHITGDYSDVFTTDTIRRFRFPEFPEEKFMTEGPLYYEFSKRYYSVFIPQIIQVGSYIDEGLTSHMRLNQIRNFLGTMYETELYLNNDTPLYFRLKKGILFDFIAMNSPLSLWKTIKKSDHFYFLILCLVPAIVFNIRNNNVR